MLQIYLQQLFHECGGNEEISGVYRMVGVCLNQKCIVMHEIQRAKVVANGIDAFFERKRRKIT